MKVGSIAFATDQGISHIVKSCFEAGVVTDVAILHHGSRTDHFEWYPPDSLRITSVRDPAQQQRLRGFCLSMDAMLFVETPFLWTLLDDCRQAGVKTTILVMYEGMPRDLPAKPDVMACPSLLDCQYYPGEPFPPVPVEVPWKQRTKALRFLHNGGHLGLRWHKGTLEILKAMEFVKSPISLTVRAQDGPELEKIRRLAPNIRGDRRITFVEGNLPYGELFDDYDVFIMAEKYNGLNLPLAEARAAGMLVMTSDRFPMNTWIPREYLIPVASYSRACVSPRCNEYDEARVEPKDIAAKIDEVYGTDITAMSLSGRVWAESMSWKALRGRWLEALS